MHNVRAFSAALTAAVISLGACAPTYPDQEALVADFLMAARSGYQADMTKRMPSLSQLSENKRYQFMLSLTGFRTFRIGPSRKTGNTVVVSVELRYPSGDASHLEISVSGEKDGLQVDNVVKLPENTDPSKTKATAPNPSP